ncbi:Abortive infection C-terminus [Lysinibacillus sp. AC-3]|nr:Abortive infection C-terminus [Lysinibacillus sp. AC-3]
MAETIAGDNEKSIYRSGPKLVDFFNDLGFDDTYGPGFPTRWVFAEAKIKEIINQDRLLEFINYSLSAEHYLEVQSQFDVDEIIEYWNSYLELDDIKIIRNGNKFSLDGLISSKVIVKEKQLEILSTEFLKEQIDKCEKKLFEKDFDGAITNARALVEEVLLEIEERLTGQREKNGGEMSALYNRIKKLINFDPGQDGLNESLKQILQGLNSIVLGIGKLRTKASDSHAREYKPTEHHARLAVNSAMTFTSFIIESYSYQQNKKIKG